MVQLCDFPPEILQQILMFCNDIATLLAVAASCRYLRAIIHKNSALWTHMNVKYWRLFGRNDVCERYEEEPMTFTKEHFRQYLCDAQRNYAHSTRAAIMEQRQLSLIIVITHSVECGHLELAIYANYLREKNAFFDEYLSSELLHSLCYVVDFNINYDVISDDVLIWMIKTIQQRSCYRRRRRDDEIFYVHGISEYSRAMRKCIRFNRLDLVKMFLENMEHSMHWTVRSAPYYRDEHLMIQKYAPCSHNIWMDVMRTLFKYGNDQTAELVVPYMSFPSPWDCADWHNELTVTISDLVEIEHDWPLLMQILQRSEVTSRHISDDLLSENLEHVPLDVLALL